MSGKVGYLAGKAAEDIVAAHYVSQGCHVRDTRWRSTGGEIDLIIEDAGAIIFVEVKKSHDFTAAAARISNRQMQRVFASAGVYLEKMPDGLDTESRFDVALVDGQGAVEILQNAYMV